MIYEDLVSLLAANNYKLTPQRREIISILIKAKTHLSAKQIFDRLLIKYPNASFDTVYRNLALLRELHTVNELDFQDGRSRYELNRQHGHHHHMICLKCGGAWEVPECPFKQLDSGAIPRNFKVTTHRFEIFGYCQNCQG